MFAGATIARRVKLVTAAWLLDSLVTGALLFYVRRLDYSPSLSAQLTLGAFAILFTGGVAAALTAEGST